jgi:hypothetical protein
MIVTTGDINRMSPVVNINSRTEKGQIWTHHNIEAAFVVIATPSGLPR